MKRVTIEIPDHYADAMTITLIGGVGKPKLYMTQSCFELLKGTNFYVASDGKIVQFGTEDNVKTCDICKNNDNKYYVLDEDAYEFQIKYGGLYYYDSDRGWQGLRIDYCPKCGRRLEG